jgi:hypothetical protein
VSNREQRWFAERFYSGVAQAQKNGQATPIRIKPAHTAKPCCDRWEVRMFLYWPKRIWIWVCDDCDVTWTESAVTKNRGCVH